MPSSISHGDFFVEPTTKSRRIYLRTYNGLLLSCIYFTYVYYDDLQKLCYILLYTHTSKSKVISFRTGPSVEGVLTICSIGSALFNKMATMPIYGKKHLKSSSPEPRKL